MKRSPTKNITSTVTNTKTASLSWLLVRQMLLVATKAAAAKTTVKSVSETTKSVSVKAKPRSQSAGKPASRNTDILSSDRPDDSLSCASRYSIDHHGLSSEFPLFISFISVHSIQVSCAACAIKLVMNPVLASYCQLRRMTSLGIVGIVTWVWC
ncbi:hypothetical protein H4582DRAFT_472734 [Lactarius indigo]|nr:hypothetical protein H4582DRAFT_472734 [Lactarius indigo]